MRYERNIANSVVSLSLLLVSWPSLALGQDGSSQDADDGDAQSCAVDDVRSGFNDAQTDIVDKVLDEAPSFAGDLKGCVGDFGVDVSIMASNWLSGFLDRVKENFCDADFSWDDIDVGGGDDPFDPGGGSNGGGSPNEPMLYSVIPDSFSQKMHEYIGQFYDDTEYYPSGAVDSSNEYILSTALVKPLTAGLASLTASLDDLKSTFDDFDCDQFIFYIDYGHGQYAVTRNADRCELVKYHFSSRRQALISMAEAAVSEWRAANP